MSQKRILGTPMCGWEDNIKVDITEMGVTTGTEFIWLRIGTSGGLFRTGNETLGPTNDKEFLDYLSNYTFLMKGPVPVS
jgi:hypothetical protein